MARTKGARMLELIYDIAPGASLAFASGAGSDAAMAAAIDILVANGADIIVDDLNGLTTEPFFQDGLAAQSVTAAVAANVTYVSSAGNRGTSGYEAPTNLKAYGDPFPDIAQIGAGVYHDWNGADDITQTITLAPGETTIVFQWDDPFGAVTSDIDVWLVNAAGTAVLDSVLEFSIANGEPREILNYDNTSGGPITAQLVIQRFSGTDAARFKWIGFNAPTVDEHLGVAEALNNPHNPGHNGTQDAISVAAASWQTPTTPESYTSRGPVTRTLDAAGNPIGLQVIDKPIVTALDRASTSVPGFTTFVGTSAAAPNAAAVAALLMSYDPSLTPAQIRTTLVDSAVDIAAAGFDYVTGCGLVQSVDAMLELTHNVLPLVGDRDFANEDDTFKVIEWRFWGPAAPTSLCTCQRRPTPPRWPRHSAAQTTHGTLWDVESLAINGRGGDDTLTITTGTDADTVELTPGATHDAGRRAGGFAAADELHESRRGRWPVVTDGVGGEGGDIRALVYNGTRPRTRSLWAVATVFLDARILVTHDGHRVVHAAWTGW